MIPRYFYSSFISQHLDVNLLLDYLIKIEENDEIVPSVIDLFINNLINSISEESHYVLVKMLERNLINSYTFKNIQDKYLWRYKNNEKNKFSSLLIRNYEEFSRNDFELHKKYVEEGVNLDEISKIIRNDDIEKLQEKSSQPNFDINHIIEPSLYERCSFINKDNVTLIDYAAFFSAVKCFKYLLMNGAKVNNTGKYAIAGGNEEIIHLCEQNHSSFEDAYETAIQYHQNEIFKYLYENKINEIEDLSNLGIECIKYDNYILFSFLEEKGMKINEQIAKMSAENGNAFIIKTFTETHQTPNYFLPNLIKQGNIEIIKLLLEQEGIDINATCNFRQTALIEASSYGYTEIVKLLLEQKEIDINVIGNSRQTALIVASMKGYTEIVKLLLEQKGIDINVIDSYENTALIWASDKGYIEIAKLLLEQEGIDINSKERHGQTALMIASDKGHIELVKLLLEQEGIDINAKDNEGKTALMLATDNHRTEIVKLLLEQEGIDINSKDIEGSTALIWASDRGYTDIVKLLLEQEGININVKGRKGSTALIWASDRGYTDIVKLLLEQKGIDVNAKDKYGQTPLICAVQANKIEAIKLLLEHKRTKVNAKDNYYYTPLMYAVENRQAEIVKLLLEQDNIKTKTGLFQMSLLDTATSNGSTEIVELLQYHDSQEKQCFIE